MRIAAIVAFAALVLPVGMAWAQGTYGGASDQQGAAVRDLSGNPVTTVRPGDTIRILCTAPPEVRCADPGAAVVFTISQSPPVILGRTTADAAGHYDSGPVRIPSTVHNGNATVTASTTLNGRPVDYTTEVTVVGSSVPVPSRAGRLPTTGRDIAFLVLWSVVLVGFGAFLISATWRRLQRSHSPTNAQPDRGREPLQTPRSEG